MYKVGNKSPLLPILQVKRVFASLKSPSWINYKTLLAKRKTRGLMDEGKHSIKYDCQFD